MNNDLQKKSTNPHQYKHGLHILTDENERDVIICREPFAYIGEKIMFSTCSQFTIAVTTWCSPGWWGEGCVRTGWWDRTGSKLDWTAKKFFSALHVLPIKLASISPIPARRNPVTLSIRGHENGPTAHGQRDTVGWRNNPPRSSWRGARR
jgi:hypothetical protein